MKEDEFELRMRAAAQGEAPEKPSPVDASLRALVEQLQGGPPAPTSERFQVVGGEPRRRDSKP